jgi:hypothetical protein
MTLNGADGLAQGSAWLTETCPPLAKLVSSPAAGCRSMRVSPLALKGAAYTVGGSYCSAFQRLNVTERFFCLRVSGAVAPSAPTKAFTTIDLSRSI